ncbi:MAG: PadR family transcriptional regulator [Actinobacteria bacterium]|nr:PadR family transcriptional regulator [Actinomycetota bacterium]
MLSLISERDTHGFAVASLTAHDAEIGQLWFVSQPMVYRSITQLAERGLIEAVGVEEGDRGPQRVVYRATRSAKSAVTHWLNAPVPHLRDLRADFVIKLVLLHRRGASPTKLIERQRAIVDETAAALKVRARSTESLDRAIFEWRQDTAKAARRLLDALIETADTDPGDRTLTSTGRRR